MSREGYAYASWDMPQAISIAPPWSLLRVTTDFEETMQPTWLIDKPLLIEGCLEKPSSVFLHDPDTIQEGEATLAFTVPAKTLNRVYSVEE